MGRSIQGFLPFLQKFFQIMRIKKQIIVHSIGFRCRPHLEPKLRALDS